MDTKSFFRLLSAMLLCALLAGCKREEPTVVQTNFDIPPSLFQRMQSAYNSVRNKKMGVEEALDGEEMVALMQQERFGASAVEISKRPRGEMTFVNDGQTDELRRQLWPFDVEAFEATLEAELGRDDEGLYCLKDEDGELEPVNPTIRWYNAKMEEWAIQQLDAVYPRVSPELFELLNGEPPADAANVKMWDISSDGQEFFSIEESEDGAWELRSYQYWRKIGDDAPRIFVDFHSFPSQKEAVAMRKSLTDNRAVNNLAVLIWRHRANPLNFDPEDVEYMLEVAKSNNISCAPANLKVLYDHIPEMNHAR